VSFTLFRRIDMPHSYRKKITDSEGTFIWQQVRENGRIRRVDSDYAGLVKWIAAGNIPPEVPYIPPTTDQLVATLWSTYNTYIKNTLQSKSIDENAREMWNAEITIGATEVGSDKFNAIATMLSWAKSVWTQYAVDKATIVGGGTPTTDLSVDFPLPVGIEFWTIEEISNSVT
jgi:hypothetical protein